MATLVPPDPREAPSPPREALKNPAETTQHQEDGSFAPGNTLGQGRPRGLPNKATRAMRAVARALTLENPEVIDRLLRECTSGKVNAFVFVTLLYYAYGKPPDKLIVDDRRPPFTVLMRKMVEVAHEERTLAGPPGESSPPEPPAPTLKALPPASAARTRHVRPTPPEPPEPADGGGIVWGD